MSWAVAPLEPHHNESALQLLARTSEAPDRGRDVFRVDRRPDFFALGRALGQTRHYGAFDGALCVGTLAVSWQRRFLAGQPTALRYVHDVRVDPAYRGSRVFARLMGAALADAGSSEKEAPVAETPFFATFLDDGRGPASLPTALGRRFSAQAIGHTRHRGLCLFSRRRGDAGVVRPLSDEEAWPLYTRLAAGRDFAPADPAVAAAQPGFWLCVMRGGHVTAVAKVVSEDETRRFVARVPLKGRALLNVWARWRNVPGLPAPGEIARVGYLSHLVAERAGAESDGQATDAAEDMAAFLAAGTRTGAPPPAFTYLFHGVPHDTASPSGLFDVTFGSRTFAFGAWPAGPPSFAFHELTLM